MFEIYFGRGIDFLGGLVDTAERLKVLTRRGAWYYQGDTRLSQVRYGARDYPHPTPLSQPRPRKTLTSATFVMSRS